MSDTKVRLSRSQLYVPATRMDMIEKAANSATDAVCIDLEDSVPPDKKEASRKNIIEALGKFDFGLRTRMIRINALDTIFAYRDIIETVEAVGEKIDLIMLPKTGRSEDVHFLDTMLTQIESRMDFPNPIGIEAQIETASGFVNLKEIGQSSTRLEALIFGPGDYAASMQMPLSNIGMPDVHDTSYPGHRWHAAMHAVVAVARTNGLRCMDGPYAEFKDVEGLENSCKIALAMGFDGKQCIHPAQLELTNTIFSPSDDDLKWAQKVIEAYEEALEEGRGAISLDGKMIDAVNIRMAKMLIHKQQAIQAMSES